MDRRRFLTRALGTIGLASLSGCDRLSQTTWFPRVLSVAEPVNERLQHALTSRDSMAREFPEDALSPHFPSNGTQRPVDPAYQALLDDNFRDWQLPVSGRVKQPLQLSLAELRSLPSRTQITRHDCVEGWSAIAKWTGARLSALLEQVQPNQSARYVVFHCFDSMDSRGTKYYESIDFEDAFHPQTILAYQWNDQRLPVAYGAPLRLRVERQLGYKMAKYIRKIEVVESLTEIGEGKGGYWEDRGYEWYAGI